MSAWYPLAGVDVVRGDRLLINGSTTLTYIVGDKLKCGSSGTNTSADYASLGILASPGDVTRISSLTIATVNPSLFTRQTLFDVSNNGTTTAGQNSYAIATGHSTSSMIFTYNDDKFATNAFAGTFVANERHVFGSSYSKTSPTNTVSYYKDGSLLGTAAYDSAVNVRYGTYPYVIGGRKPSSGSHGDVWGGTLELNVLFPFVLTSAEFWALSQNPWQLFESARRAVFFAAPAGGTTHTTTGVLTGPGSTVDGTAAHLTLHATTGVLTGAGSTVVGAALHPHTSTGDLVGPGSSIVGAAVHPHVTTGDLVGTGSTVAGTAVHPHTTTGVLTGAGSEIAGVAEHSTPGAHATDGALTGAGSTVSGTAAHLGLHATTGALVGPGSAINGTAERLALHATDGILVGAGAVVVGAAAHSTSGATAHDTSGSLVGSGSTLAGLAGRNRTGSLPGFRQGYNEFRPRNENTRRPANKGR